MLKGDQTKEKIKTATRALIHSKGYNNTSINDILNASGIKKGNLYFHYQSKEALISEVLKETLAIYENQVDPDIRKTTITNQIFDIIDAVTDYHANVEKINGCMFGNLALELGHDETEMSLFVENVFKKWAKRFERLFELAVEENELVLQESAEDLARIVIATMEGGVLLAKVSGEGDQLRNCTSFIKKMINDRKIKKD